MVRIWLMNTGLLREETAYRAALSSCSVQRRARIEGARLPEDRLRLLAAAVLLDRALQPLGLREKDAEFAYGPGGKPYIPALPDFHFSLSHSGEMAACAVSEQEVGTDIQEPRVISLRLQERYFTRRELEAADAVTLWTMKESYGKLTGEGVAVLGSTELLFDGGTAALLRNGIRQEVSFAEKTLENGYRLATCVHGNTSLQLDMIVVNRSDGL